MIIIFTTWTCKGKRLVYYIMENSEYLVKPIGGSHDFFRYDVQTQIITEHSLLLSHSFTDDYGICYLSASSVFISGGYNPASGALVAHTFTVDLNSFEVQDLCPHPVALKGLRLLSYNNEVYSVAGCSQVSSDFTVEGYCFKYSPSRNAWVQLAEMPDPCVFPGTFLQNSHIWVSGGLTKAPNTTVLDKIRIYNILNNTWVTSELKLLRPSYLHGIFIFPDNHVLIFGGLRDEMSNRFSYFLGSEVRKILPDKISMGFIDPPLLTHTGLYAFNDEMTLFEYKSDWNIQELNI